MAAAEAERERSALRRREEPHRAEHVGPRPYQSLRPAPGSSLHPVLYHRGAIAFAFEGLEDGQGLALHAEPYLMFSTDKKSLLCIRCFRDLQGAGSAASSSLSLQDKLAERKALLLQAVQSQYEEKDKAFKEQLSHLATLLPTLQVHLVICSSFLSLASKAEFLDLGYMLGSPVQKPTLHRSIGTKVLLAEGEDTPFAEHCRHYEDSYRHLQAEMQSLKDQVQELHRDLTKHHSLIKAEIMADILRKALQVDAQIGSEYASVEGMRAAFQEMWEESYQRVADEQEIYEAQLHDLLQLKQENACLTTITKQITPYVRSIAKVKERLEPRFQAPVDEESEQLQDLGDDSTKDEAQARSDPACGADKRETSEPRGNSRTQQSLAEEPPLQSKDPHGPKARNGGDVPPRRERPT
ncbi:RING finger protein 207 [Myotis davidii]|uniref:RING finger protein 207 n=1 Tax=Myotis davidii TaxID=225400 RepID=L5LNP4_MYODS|nr:RING finger protein 207 [Myotis davidii]